MGFFDSKLFIVLSIILLYQSLLLLHPPIASANDILMPGDELAENSTLISSNGKFTIGFYTVPSYELSGRKIKLTYLAIWLTNMQDVYIVWASNPNVPISAIAILTMDASGTVRVMNRSGATLFNVSDDYNVDLQGNNNNNTRRAKLQDSGNFIVYDIVTNRTIWESFDHPTNTLIPGMKLGYNLTAKKNWELTSWSDDLNYPTSGEFTMRLKQYQNSPQLLIYRFEDLYWASGPWNKTTGTFQWEQQIIKNWELIAWEGPSRFELTYDPSGMYLFVQMIGSAPASILVLTPMFENRAVIYDSRWILILLIVHVLVLVYVIIRIRIFKGKENKRRDDIIHQLTGTNSFNYGDELERGIQEAPDIKIFSLKAILAATINFSSENKLGQGGYRPVYKGELSDGRKIAVKRLSKTSGQGIIEFKSELILISKLQHKNLVRLYGCCIHQEERMLIYEFMPNKSLDFFLFDGDNKAKIDWQIRFKIIQGIAHGLIYLHMYSRMRVIHRDLKVSNVLLDENMNPKIADFGMARIFQHDMSVLMTKRVAGTYGYMAPEYVIHGTFSIKSDVFSFGVLILEIVSGKKNSSFHSLLKCAWELWKREATLEMKDETLGENFDVHQLLRAIHVGILCVQEHEIDRPTISQVISMLNNEITELPIPKKPLFFMHPNEVETTRSTEQLFGNTNQGSANGLTITTMEAR